MRDLIDFLRPCVGAIVPGSHLGCYVFAGGAILADDRRTRGIFAGGPLTSLVPLDCVVPADELDRALSRAGDDPSLSLDDDVLLVRGGRVRAEILTVAVEPPPPPDLSSLMWTACPEGLVRALKLASEHVGDRGYTAGVRVGRGRVTAISGNSGVDVSLALDDLPYALLPVAVVDVLVKTGDPAEVAADGGLFAARWSDGRWAVMQLLQGEMPEQVDNLFASPTRDGEVAVTDEWRGALADVAAMSDGHVELRAGGFASSRRASKIDVAFETGLPEGHASRWALRVLTSVLAQAASWDPTAYPRACGFWGPSLRGLVMGAR